MRADPLFSGMPIMIDQPSSVDHPPHYNQSSIEVIAAIEAWELDFHGGNVVKYLVRAKHKGHELEDLQKALWYLQRKIDLIKNP
jgi:hypothetical protein